MIHPQSTEQKQIKKEKEDKRKFTKSTLFSIIIKSIT